MRELFEAIRDRLVSDPHAIPSHFTDAPGKPAYPYALIWGGSGLLGTDTLCDRDDLDDTFSVTWVSLSALGVLDLRAIGRAALDGWTPASSVWRMQPITLLKRMGQDVQVDRDVIFPSTDQHAYFAVDRFRLAGDLT